MEGEEIARQLCVQVGIIMEDAGVGAISTHANVAVQVAALKAASNKIHALVNAAEALIRE